MFAIPTLLFISLLIFLLVDLAPGSPMSQIPLTVPPEVRMKIMEAMGVNEPVMVRYLLWLKQFFVVEPLVLWDHWFSTDYSAGMQRIVSWQSRSPVMDIVVQRLPQTMTVIGTSYVLGVLIALPIGIYSASLAHSSR
jgi:peptide/nickel transport system permease protein